MKEYFFKTISSPLGELKLVASNEALVAILWQHESIARITAEAMYEDRKHPVLITAEKQLGEYFLGKRQSFDVKIHFNGTDFQKNVWKALLIIPFGNTVSYADIAKKIGRPKAVRAVGSANRKNPVPIIVACHRVISSSGALAGYSGGVENKAVLLEAEGVFGHKVNKKPHVL